MSLTDKDSKPIIHIATDEKFIDAAYEIYEKAFQGKNTFIILKNAEQTEMKHLSNEKDFCFVDFENGFLKEIEEIAANSRVIVFHGLNYSQALVAKNLKKNERLFVWSVFGAEIYNNPLIFSEKAYGKLTNKKFVSTLTNYLKDLLRKPFYRVFKKSDDRHTLGVDAIKRMDYIGILYEEEFNLYRELEITYDSKFLPFTYYPVEIILDKTSGYVESNNILLGNSASFTNNHLEVFERLKKLDFTGHLIMTPLSYGNQKYANQIIGIGNKKLGENFKPLTEFLPLFEFQKILQSCGIVIMNHYRQQAVGNVMNAIYLGAKVYLSNRNTLYHYLKRIGCHVYCVEDDLTPGNPTVFDLLDKKQMFENREILKKELSLERFVNELKQKLIHVLD